jgi:hypothetical protein
MEGSYLSANFFREIVAAESFSYDPSRPKPQFVTLTGAGSHAAESNTHMAHPSSSCGERVSTLQVYYFLAAATVLLVCGTYGLVR